MANYSDVKASGAIVKSYANFAAFPSSGNSAGDLVLALDTGGIYVWDGSEWDRVASGVDELPEFTTEPAASYELESDGTATIITVAATDPEGFPITYSHDTVPSNQAQATITNSGGTFTVTPSTNTANAGTFTLRLKASDGVNVSSKSSLLNLVFATNEVDISPALNSATTLNRADGNITGFATNTVYTLTNNSTRAIVFDWTLNGAGGGHSSGGAGGGAGGQTTGRWSLAGNGGTVNLLVGSKVLVPQALKQVVMVREAARVLVYLLELMALILPFLLRAEAEARGMDHRLEVQVEALREEMEVVEIKTLLHEEVLNQGLEPALVVLEKVDRRVLAIMEETVLVETM